MKKDVIYIDVEDDITSIIARLKQAKTKIVALVPPKRASVLSSVVNLKLLKKAANDKNKQLVVVTTDPALLSLAGGLEMYVAKNLTTPPEIPESSSMPDIPSDTITSASRAGTEEMLVIDSDKPAEETETEVDSEKLDKASTKKPKLAPISKAKLPNFERFRKRIFIGIAVLALLIIGWWQAFFVMPRADIVLRGQTTNVRAEFDVTLDESADDLDVDERILPSEVIKIENTDSSEVLATGEKNEGDKATGSVTIYNNTLQSRDLVASTRFKASNGLIYRLNTAVELPRCNIGLFSCSSPSETNATMTADAPGDSYNIGADDYTIPGLDESLQDRVYGEAGPMGGGTNDIVKVITEGDVERAIASLEENEETLDFLAQIRKEAGDDAYVFDETLTSTVSGPQLDQPVGTEINQTQVSVTTTSVAYSVARSDLDQLLTALYQEEVGEQQSIAETGIDNIVTDVKSSQANAVVGIIANGKAGPNVNTEELAQQLVKLRFSEAKNITDNLPGIVESSIDLSPFWVGNMPRSADKITIEISDPEL